MADDDARLHRTTIEHEGTWCGVEIPYAMLARLGWTQRDVRVVVKRCAQGVVVRRADEDQQQRG